MPLRDFLLEWNRTHELVSFLAYKIAGSSRPISVEIRYPEIEKFDFLHDDAWKNLNQMLLLRWRIRHKKLFKRNIYYLRCGIKGVF